MFNVLNAYRPVGAVALLLAIAAVSLFAFLRLEPSVQSSVLIVGAGIVTFVMTSRREKSKTIKEVHRTEKIAAYSEFFDLIVEVLKRSSDTRANDNLAEYLETDDFKNKMFSVMRNVSFYGSHEVVIAFTNWRRASTKSDAVGYLRIMGRLLLAMRDDIGLSNRGLSDESIFLVYLKPDEAKSGGQI